MIIKNKATKKEYEITQEQWANIVANVNLRYKYSVVSTKDISNRIIEDSEKIIKTFSKIKWDNMVSNVKGHGWVILDNNETPLITDTPEEIINFKNKKVAEIKSLSKLEEEKVIEMPEEVKQIISKQSKRGRKKSN